MNCQKGDLAIMVGDPNHQGPTINVGKIVKCLELMPAGFHFRGKEPEPIWRTDGKFHAGEMQHEFMYDKWLKPLRDPGPDAIDETIQRLGTPMDMRLRELENELAKMNESLDRLEKVLTR